LFYHYRRWVSGAYGLGAGGTFIHYREYNNYQRWKTAGRHTVDRLIGLRESPSTYHSNAQGLLFKSGLQPMYRIVNGLHLYFPLQMIFGVEETRTFTPYSSEGKTNKIFGLTTGGGICFASPSWFGIYTGLHAYGLFTSAQSYSKDFGVAFELGIKF
jgi:hypothetical protein